MEENNWNRYQVHVLQTLSELKRNDEKHTAQLSEMNTVLSALKNSQKWEIRLISFVWGIILAGLNYIWGHIGKP
jgi:hypothetical protein